MLKLLACLELLHRLRDLTWTLEDYYWLCKRKSSMVTFQERLRFRDAPVIMDFRRTTETNPEDNCEYYNRMLNRALARERKQPVVGFSAIHEGISQSHGLGLDDSRFFGLPAHFELSEEAWLILTHNLKPELGLMNGTRGTAKRIVYAPGCHPSHDDPARPEVVVLLSLPSRNAEHGSLFSHAPFPMKMTDRLLGHNIRSFSAGLSRLGKHRV